MGEVNDSDDGVECCEGDLADSGVEDACGPV